MVCFVFFFQAEDGIRDFCLSRGLGDVYKRQAINGTGGDSCGPTGFMNLFSENTNTIAQHGRRGANMQTCLLYTSDAADEEDSVDLGGRRIIKKKKN